MCLAREKDVDMVLLAGDLFHDNKPSRKAMFNVMRSLRMNCFGEKPCELEMLSDSSEVFEGYASTSNRFWRLSKLTSIVGHSITSITKIQTSMSLSRSFLYMATMMTHQGYVEISALGDDVGSQLLGWPFCSPRFAPSSRLD